ncbi:transglycosylase domain-containing protein [uncultured Roseibium sp.]|uniref:transglycosylase domain-containing protein n=1 Tax=uncultured Roseibium sp. TaxID=1936171 RepID=UPI0026224A77|nr:transglycosylase domain-containing protein [uncultured Roseibium sp.]
MRQTGYALGLEREQDKEQIMVLWLATLEMGRGPDGWVTGFHKMSESMFGSPPGAIEADEYLSLLAVLVAPGRYNLGTDDQALQERKDRIRRLLAGECVPNGNSDVWLEGCNS